MNKSTYSRILNSLLAMLFAVVLVSCGGEEKVGTENMISGTSSKTWVAEKELTASGDKDKLTKEEKQETMQFYADGRFAMGGGGALETGTWSFDQSARRLTLQYEEQNMAMTFDVTKLTEKEMTLRDAQGGTMELKTK
jgi:hypothetical protein